MGKILELYLPDFKLYQVYLLVVSNIEIHNLLQFVSLNYML